MSFATILRKSVSSFTPLASRLAQGRRHYHCALVTAINNANISHKQFISPLVPSFHSSSASKKSSSEESLVQVIDSEIQCAAESDDHEQVSFLISIYFIVVSIFASLLLVWFLRKWWGDTFGKFSRFRLVVYEKPCSMKSNHFVRAGLNLDVVV